MDIENKYIWHTDLRILAFNKGLQLPPFHLISVYLLINNNSGITDSNVQNTIPTLERLPRELRQRIFKLVSYPLVDEDVQVNCIIIDCIRRYDGFYRFEEEFLVQNSAALDTDLASGASVKIHNPNIHDQALTLHDVFSDIVTTYHMF